MGTSVSLRPTQFASELVSNGSGTSVSTGVEEKKMDSDAGRFGDGNPCALSSIFMNWRRGRALDGPEGRERLPASVSSVTDKQRQGHVFCSSWKPGSRNRGGGHTGVVLACLSLSPFRPEGGPALRVY